MNNGESPGTITYLENKEIDKAKWDSCITNAGNGLIYARSFFLDAMSRDWDALVMGDYLAVMPLLFNKKYGIYYLYQPPFIRFTGIFGNDINAEKVNKFLAAIPVKYKYWDIDFKEHLIDFNIIDLINISLKKIYPPIEAMEGSVAVSWHKDF